MTQWHPLFAKLLRPMLEAHYDVQTGTPVGDVPRMADIVLVRRTSTGKLPYQGLWRWLTPWNVLEYKGPTVSARVDDLDDLLEVGWGIHRRLNEERVKRREARVERTEVSFWYLANHLGRRFLRDVEALVGPLEMLEAGLWRVRLVQRDLFLVSSRTVAVERDSVPLHVLARESDEARLAVARLVVEDRDLWDRYGPWLAFLNVHIHEEVIRMARVKKRRLPINLRLFLKEIGAAEALNQIGMKEAVEAMGVDQFLAHLTPKQRRELQRRLKDDPRDDT